MKYCFKTINRIFDYLEKFWKSDNFRKFVSALLAIVFVGAVILTQLKIYGKLPSFLEHSIPDSQFYPIRLSFSLLLIYEVLSMIFSLRYSVSNSLGKQIEILSLVILRDGFKDLVYFHEPFSLFDNLEPLTIFLSDIFGALIILTILGYYYKIQSHIPITTSEDDQYSFITFKKASALMILLIALLIGVLDFFGYYETSKYFSYFDTLFTFLIFNDVLLVFLALRYSSNFYIIFRNSGFALTTVLIRIAFTAPPYHRSIIGIITVLFALTLSWGYNKFRVNIKHWDM